MERIYTIKTIEKVGERVLVKGWVHARRDMGKIVFIDLRDKEGLLQVVLTPGDLSEFDYEAVKKVRPEWVVELEGEVQERGGKQVNENMSTGTVEVLAKTFKVINEAETLPFEIDKDTRVVNEELRLKYRYLDLRSERMSRNIKTRQQVFHYARNFLVGEGFTEIQTPILTKSSPEGARDYLVPSRKFLGKFFALPQSPQQYKQLLMVAGVERYFQIAPCFRDEDARADRSPGEFYQIDMEMSFMSQDDILEFTEKMFTKMVKELFPEKELTFESFPRLNYDDMMKEHGTDKPDLRKDKSNSNELAFAWVVNFPLFERQDQDKNSEDHFHGTKGAWAPSHHMFTRPRDEDLSLLESDPGKVYAYQHDLVLNGLEVGGGSVRIHDPKLQDKIFDLIGFNAEDKKKFAHLLEAFKYGAPPHGGIAPGLDRLVSILAGEQNIREVIAFPLMSEARDPLMDSPAEVASEQLNDLGIELKVKN